MGEYETRVPADGCVIIGLHLKVTFKVPSMSRDRC